MTSPKFARLIKGAFLGSSRGVTMTEQFNSPNLVDYAYRLEGFDNARKFLQFRQTS